MLLRFKADVNAVDKNKKTPLYYALFNGHVEIVKVWAKSLCRCY